MSGESDWFESHYNVAAREIVEYVESEALSFEGKTVADIGCGDGIIDLGLAHLCPTAQIVGFDIRAVDEARLAQLAKQQVAADTLPANLDFSTCSATTVPVADASFDAVVTWSAFEHIADPVEVAAEMRRIVKPNGFLFLQLWPFFATRAGSHLDDWFPEGFVQHRLSPIEISEHIRSHPRPDLPDFWPEMKITDYAELNRISLDDLQRVLLASHWGITRVDVYVESLRIPDRARHLPLSSLLISGVKLVAVPT
jgi:ubiquinone/menaquinone biosynthesis C-methylase UbiE